MFDVKAWCIGVRICYEIRYPEFFREPYKQQTDLNVVLCISQKEDEERYDLIRSHIRTRAVENVTYTLTVNTCSSFQTAPTGLYNRSGAILAELKRDEERLLVFDLEKEKIIFGERGRKEISDCLTAAL